jgi:hypothetical protein
LFRRRRPAAPPCLPTGACYAVDVSSSDLLAVECIAGADRHGAMMRRLLPALVLRAGVVAAAVSPFVASDAHAQWSSASVFTEDGVELGVEPRIFALFALMNSAGYDKESVFGPPPLERPAFEPTREKLRQNLGRSSLKEAADLFAKFPGSTVDYVNAVLELGPAPKFDDKAAKSPLAKALAGPLREWFNEEGGSSLLRNAYEGARSNQKRLLPLLAKATGDVTKTVRLGDASDQLLDGGGAQGRVAIVLNDLDAHGTFFVVTAGETTGIVTGPSRGEADDNTTIDAATLAYARTVVAAEADKVTAAGTLVEGHGKLGDAAKAALPTDKLYARELLACAVAREVRARAVSCGVLDGDAEARLALDLIAPRMAAYAKTTALLSAAMGELLAPPPPPPPPVVEQPVEEPKKKKKGKG